MFSENKIILLYAPCKHPINEYTESLQALFWHLTFCNTWEIVTDKTWRFLLSLHGCSSGFLTGFRRVPILGMDQIQMTIRVKQIQSSSSDQHFPESLTCHSILELPLYSTKEIMRDRLTEALIPEGGYLWWWSNSWWAGASTLSVQGKGGPDFYFRTPL